MPTQTASSPPAPSPTLTPTLEQTVTAAGPRTPAQEILTGRLTDAQTTASISVRWNQGDVVDICLRSREFDTHLQLTDANGVELAANDDYGQQLDACIMEYAVAATGDYSINISSYDHRATGSYRLEIANYGSCGRMPVAVVLTANSNLRSSPNRYSDVLGVLSIRQCFPIVGRAEDSTWWQVVAPNEQLGWVHVGVVNTVGSVSAVNVVP
jgi:hypothetical protein